VVDEPLPPSPPTPKLIELPDLTAFAAEVMARDGGLPGALVEPQPAPQFDEVGEIPRVPAIEVAVVPVEPSVPVSLLPPPVELPAPVRPWEAPMPVLPEQTFVPVPVEQPHVPHVAVSQIAAPPVAAPRPMQVQPTPVPVPAEPQVREVPAPAPVVAEPFAPEPVAPVVAAPAPPQFPPPPQQPPPPPPQQQSAPPVPQQHQFAPPPPVRLAAPGDAMLHATAAEMASAFEELNSAPPTWGPGNGLPTTLAPWQPPVYNPGEGPDRYRPASPLTSFYVAPKKSRGALWMAAVLVLLLAAGGFFGYKVLTHDKAHMTLPPGSGVAAGDPTAPPDGPGAVYTSNAGHFAVRFPTGDKIQTHSEADDSEFGNIKVTGAGDEPANLVVFEADLPQSIALDRAKGALNAEAASFSPGLKLKFEAWHGRPAVEGISTYSGQRAHLLIVLYGASRAYYLVAGDDAGFTQLKSSFVALP